MRDDSLEVRVLKAAGGIYPKEVQELLLKAMDILESGKVSDNPIRFCLQNLLGGAALFCENLQWERRPKQKIPLMRRPQEIERFIVSLEDDLKRRKGK